MGMDFKSSLLQNFPSSVVEPLLKSIYEGEVTHSLLLNTKKMKTEEFEKRFPNVKKHPFISNAYLYDKDEYEFGKYLLYDNGVYSIEDSAAMMVNYFLKPEKDDIVLDICAAPGGKTIGASLMMEDQGVIIANDIRYPRAKAMSQNVERMGRGNIICASNDFVFSHQHFLNTFDKIIVDAPCSGSAMFRKNPKAEEDWSEKKVKVNERRQRELLNLAYLMLKPGGVMSYSTCSFSSDENENTLTRFLCDNPDATLINLEDNPMFYRPALHPEAVYLFPHLFPGEGQFIALIKKPGHSEKTKKTIKESEYSTRKYKNFLEKYGLIGRSNEVNRAKFYSLYQHFDISHLNILRYGVKLFEMRDIYIPDHHLAHFLTPDYSIPVKKEDAQAYIEGKTFLLDKPDDFYIISYDNQNLGFVKTVDGVAKNHYPKGLRRHFD